MVYESKGMAGDRERKKTTMAVCGEPTCVLSRAQQPEPTGPESTEAILQVALALSTVVEQSVTF